MSIATTPISSTSLDEVSAMGIDTRIIAQRSERHFCRCASCKRATTIDFEIIAWEFAFQTTYNGGRVVWEPRSTAYRDGHEVPRAWIANCPRCGAAKPVNTTLKTVTFHPDHACDDRCQRATSETCVCACGGANHGLLNKPEERA